MRVASTDYQQALSDTLRKAQPSMGKYPANTYAPSLPVVQTK